MTIINIKILFKMKKIKFLPILMAVFMGLSFGLTSCGDDDDDNANNEQNKEFVESDVIQNGRNFYIDLQKAKESGSEADKLRVVADALDYSKNKSNSAWTSNFLAGVVMEKYNVDDANVAKSEEYMKKVADVKNLLDNGITSDNVADALIKLATFISTRDK
jgi:hypothetical protein